MSIQTPSIIALQPDCVLRRRIGLAVCVVVAIVGLVYLYRTEPVGARFTPQCLFHSLTGFFCPGCGTTRALHAVMHGHVLAAIHFNPLLVVIAPFFLYAFGKWAWAVVWGRPHVPVGRGLSVRTIWIIGIVLCVYWVARNVPVYPCTLLAPP